MKLFYLVAVRVRLESIWTSLVLVSLVLCWWCWPTVSGATHLGFRDLSIFYTPLYTYLTQRIWTGDFPQWNPLSMTGVPVLGDSTSGLLYPPRWVFMIPGVSAERWMDLYCLGHL
jgi:hypothetical protein